MVEIVVEFVVDGVVVDTLVIDGFVVDELVVVVEVTGSQSLLQFFLNGYLKKDKAILQVSKYLFLCVFPFKI